MDQSRLPNDEKQLIERDFRPHSIISNAAYGRYTEYKSTPNGRQHNGLMFLLLTAFALEAYINLLGSFLQGTDWDEKEFAKKVGGNWRKASKILLAADASADFGQRPYQSMKSLMTFRDEVAHAKPRQMAEVMRKERIDKNLEKFGTALPSSWEELIEDKFIEIVYEDFQAVTKRTWSDQFEEFKDIPQGPFHPGYEALTPADQGDWRIKELGLKS